MPFRRFLPYDVLGAGLWATTFILIGYLFWHSLDRVLEIAKQGAFALGIVISVIVGLVWMVRHFRDEENRARFEAGLWRALDRPLLRPGPPARLLVSRPGALLPRAPHARRARPRADEPAGDRRGRLVRVLRHLARASPTSSLTAGDRQVAEWSQRTHSPALVDIAKVITVLGDPGWSSSLLLAAVLVLLSRRRIMEGAVLTAGFLLDVRLRPDRARTSSSGRARRTG